jgi:hypothetical protein
LTTFKKIVMIMLKEKIIILFINNIIYIHKEYLIINI